jgi:hypothetical protein
MPIPMPIPIADADADSVGWSVAVDEPAEQNGVLVAVPREANG